MKITKHLIVNGQVQGVGYRASMIMEARRLNVTGWVRNRRAGGVEAIVHGWPSDVAQILNWARRGPAGAQVTGMEVTDSSGAYESFDQRPSS